MGDQIVFARFAVWRRGNLHHYRAALHDEDAIGESDQLCRLIGDEDDSHSLRCQFPDLLINFFFRPGVDAASGIIQHENAQVSLQPTGKHNLLLIAA